MNRSRFLTVEGGFPMSEQIERLPRYNSQLVRVRFYDHLAYCSRCRIWYRRDEEGVKDEDV